eukprot:3058994-Prymnesium_polylepis.1
MSVNAPRAASAARDRSHSVSIVRGQPRERHRPPPTCRRPPPPGTVRLPHSWPVGARTSSPSARR